MTVTMITLALVMDLWLLYRYLGDDWAVTTQFVARGSNAWDLEAEWAYISFDASDERRLLFGRQRAPFYMYSDFLDVSYAYHWIKPPSGVYSLPFDVFDGINLFEQFR